MNKRGQFYIMAAVIIVFVLISLAGVATYAAIKQKPQNVYDLSSDLKKESYNLVDYGVYNKEGVDILMKDFLDTKFGPYYLKKTSGTEIIFIYGNTSGVEALAYRTRNTGKIELGNLDWEAYGAYSEIVDNVEVVGNKIKINVLEKPYEFDLKENEIFYFIMVHIKDDETYIEKN